MQGVHATAFSSILKLIQVPNVTLFNYNDDFFFPEKHVEIRKVIKTCAETRSSCQRNKGM